MEQSPNLSSRLSLSFVAPAQAQKHVTVNETFRRLDALTQLTVRSRTISTQAATPSEGDAYILPAGASGDAWDNFSDGALAVFQDGAWVEIASVEGMRAYIADEAIVSVFDGATWTEISGNGSGGGVVSGAPTFGVNTSADTTNRLSVKSDAVLFSHDDVTPGSGNARIVVNKSAPSDTASHLFQTGFSGRAEFGLTGDDNLAVKVSPDGTIFHTAFTIEKDSGYFALGKITEPQAVCHVSGDTMDLFELTGALDHPSGVGVNFGKSRGTIAAPASVASNDTIGVIRGKAYNGVAYKVVTNIRQRAESVSGSIISSRFEFACRNTADALVNTLIISATNGATWDVPVRYKNYSKTSLPPASIGAGTMIYVTNDVGGGVPAFSDGTNWRRVTDRVVIS